MNNPQYIHIGVGDHWIKCGQEFGNNYVALKKENGADKVCDPLEGTCVVCGKSASERDCLPRND